MKSLKFRYKILAATGIIYSALMFAFTAPGLVRAEPVLQEASRNGPEWRIIQTLSPLPEVPPPDTTNAFGDDPRAARLGQMLFFEKAIGGPIITGDDGHNGGLGQPGRAASHRPATGRASHSDSDDQRGAHRSGRTPAQWPSWRPIICDACEHRYTSRATNFATNPTAEPPPFRRRVTLQGPV